MANLSYFTNPDFPESYGEFPSSATFQGGVWGHYNLTRYTLPETNSLSLKIGHFKRKRSYSNHPFSSHYNLTRYPPKFNSENLRKNGWGCLQTFCLSNFFRGYAFNFTVGISGRICLWLPKELVAKVRLCVFAIRFLSEASDLVAPWSGEISGGSLGVGAICFGGYKDQSLSTQKMQWIPGSSRYVKFLPFGKFFGWKGTNSTHLEDPGIHTNLRIPPNYPTFVIKKNWCIASSFGQKIITVSSSHCH